MSDSELEIDDIFAQLQQRIKVTQPSDAQTPDKFEQIQQSIRKLPTISSALFEDQKTQELRALQQRRAKTRISDPVTGELINTSKKDKTAEKKHKSDAWFEIPKKELTPELKRDLTILKNRSVLDPKKFYKKEKWVMPERFQMGTVVEPKSEFYSSRIKNKDRGRTLTEEILKDDEKKRYYKRKYNEIQDKKISGGKSYYQKLKERRKKF